MRDGATTMLRKSLGQFWDGEIDIKRMVGAIVNAVESVEAEQMAIRSATDDLSANASRDRDRISALERIPCRVSIDRQQTVCKLISAAGAMVEAFDNWFEHSSTVPIDGVIRAENQLSAALSAAESVWRSADGEAGEFQAAKKG